MNKYFMKKLKCPSCAREWYIENAYIDELNFCPYCAGSIRGKAVMGRSDSLDKVIYKAISSCGVDIFSNPPQLMGVLKDLAPRNLEKEVRIFSKAFTGECLQIYKDAFDHDIFEAEKDLLKIRHLLIENEGLSESWAEMLFQNCLKAVMYTKGSGLPSAILAKVTNITLTNAINRLMADVSDKNNKTVLGSSYMRSSIYSITFLGTLDDVPEDAWDVSEDGSGSVRAWVSTSQHKNLYDLFIAASGVIAASNCYKLFANYENLKKIEFNDIFDTSQVTTMELMFSGCTALEKLNLDSFDTSQVTSMWLMFSGCTTLEKLNLDSFDTSQVTSMNSMFHGCAALKELDLGGFDTSQVANMSSMFDGCTALKKLDLSSFNTSQVTNMSSMFHDCTALEKLNLRGFNISQVAYMDHMFDGCTRLEKSDLGNLIQCM